VTSVATTAAGEAAVPLAVALRSVTKVFGEDASRVVALDNISLDVTPGRIVCLVGASGCGKTTMLNLVAGLEQPTAGTVESHGRSALMFQESALFSWLTLSKNVELALKLRGLRSVAARRAEAMRLLEMVHLEDFAKARPHQVSGGMRQRGALARALAQKPDVLLMDEPFGSLDAMTRDLLHEELEGLWQAERFTVLFVTHNVREAVRLGDEVVVLSSRPGRVVDRVPIEIPRPRRMDSPEVATAAAAITDQLRDEVRRHGRS